MLIGGAGFIGHNLALDLNRRDYEVHLVDSLGINNLLALYSTDRELMNRRFYQKVIRSRLDLLEEDGIPIYVQDAREYHQVCHLVDKIKPDVVVLLAAVAHADRSNKDPYNTFDHSLRTLENTLDATRNSSAHFVYFSSSMVYGNFADGVVTEETACEPLGIYGALKYSGEKIVIAYNQVFNVPYTIIRPSALYGERCISGRVGQLFIENAMRGLDITVKGDGSARLDFTYVDDLVQGIRLVIENENARNQIFNLTYGESRSVNQMAEILKEHFPKIEVNYEQKDKLTPDRGTLSVDKARELIGYDPQWPLERGFVNYIEWYKSVYSKYV